MSRRLVKRRQFSLLGGKVYVRIYDDGTSRVRTDHPSNHPATELMMMAVVMSRLDDAFAEVGLEKPKWGPITLRDDPPKAGAA